MGIFDTKHKPYWPLIPILFMMAACMIWMNSNMPPADLAPNGYSSVIIAFEFIMDRSDLDKVLSPLSAGEIDGLDRLNYIDFGYMVLYSSLLAGFFFITKKIEGVKYLKIGMALAACALFSDLFENVQLLDLTEMYRSSVTSGYESVISNLFIFTWLKWGALAVAMALLVPVLIKRGRLLSKVIALCLSIPLIMLFAVVIFPSPSIMDKFSTSIILGFLAIIVYIFAYRQPRPIL